LILLLREFMYPQITKKKKPEAISSNSNTERTNANKAVTPDYRKFVKIEMYEERKREKERKRERERKRKKERKRKRERERERERNDEQ